MLRKLAFVLAAFVALTGCGSAAMPGYDYSKEFDPRGKEYKIGVGDSLLINVFHQPDMSGSALVRPDGIITMPLVGDLSVVGKTPTQVKTEMRAMVARFVKDEGAVVTVAVTNSGSYRFVVAGNVGHPGSFTQPYYVNVSEAIALAGGLSRFAGTGVTIMRPSPAGGVREIKVDYVDITSGRHPEQNLMIVAGDTVFVP